MCTIDIYNTGCKFATGINNTGKFVIGVNNSSGKFAEGVNSTTLNKGVKKNNWNFSDCRFFPFAAGVNDTGGAPWAANIFTNFKKIWTGHKGIRRGLGEETDS